jgi:hypothetical protein
MPNEQQHANGQQLYEVQTSPVRGTEQEATKPHNSASRRTFLRRALVRAVRARRRAAVCRQISV